MRVTHSLTTIWIPVGYPAQWPGSSLNKIPSHISFDHLFSSDPVFIQKIRADQIFDRKISRFFCFQIKNDPARELSRQKFLCFLILAPKIFRYFRFQTEKSTDVWFIRPD